jgi:hypothetical protein
MISGFLCHIDGLSSVVDLTAFIEGSSYFMPSFLRFPWSLFHLFRHFLLYLLSFPLRTLSLVSVSSIQTLSFVPSIIPFAFDQL